MPISSNSNDYTILFDGAAQELGVIPFEQSTTSDTITVIHSSDTHLSGAVTNTHEIDTSLILVPTNTHTLDGHILLVSFLDHTVDTHLSISERHTHLIDSHISGTETLTHLFDGDIFLESDLTHIIDSHLTETVNILSFTIDTNLHNKLVLTNRLDAYIDYEPAPTPPTPIRSNRPGITLQLSLIHI